MLNFKITTGAINYEETLHNFFPMLTNKLYGMEQDKNAFRIICALFDKLGSEAEKVAMRLMENLPEQSKNELVCQLIFSYKSQLTKKLNEIFAANDVGKYIHLGLIGVEQTERDGLELLFTNVSIDFKKMLSSKAVLQKIEVEIQKKMAPGGVGKIAGKVAMGTIYSVSILSNDETEQAGAALLNQPNIKDMVLEKLQLLLSSKSIAAPLNDISVGTDTGDDTYDSLSAGRLQLSDKLEDALLTALAEYIKGKVRES